MYGKTKSGNLINCNGVRINKWGVYIAQFDERGLANTPCIYCSPEKFDIPDSDSDSC